VSSVYGKNAVLIEVTKYLGTKRKISEKLNFLPHVEMNPKSSMVLK
jgi:hypothetical protein